MPKWRCGVHETPAKIVPDLCAHTPFSVAAVSSRGSRRIQGRQRRLRAGGCLSFAAGERGQMSKASVPVHRRQRARASNVFLGRGRPILEAKPVGWYHGHGALWRIHAAWTRPSGSELARLCFPPHHGRGECCKRMIVQAHRVAFSLAGKTQDATCELVRPHLVITVAPERQPSLVECCFQGCERLGIERSTTKSTHVSSPEQGSCWNRFDPIIPTMWPTL